MSMDEVQNNSLSNASNNERNDDLYKNAQTSSDNATLIQKEEKAVEEDIVTTSRLESKENKKDRSKNKKGVSAYPDRDRNVAYGNTSSTADSTTVSINDLLESEQQPVTGGNQPGSPVNAGLYNTATTSGSFGTDKTYDIIPDQMNIQQTSELKKLFKTFR